MVIGNTVTEAGDIILIKLVEPYKKVVQILSYEDVTVGEDTNNYFQKYFRWSTDNKIYSDYVQLTDVNLQKLTLDPVNEFWIEYKYESVELDTGNVLEFSSIALEVITDQGRVLAQVQANVGSCDPNDPSCVGNLIVEECCDNDNLFNPYAWANQANCLYDQLSEITTKIFGHCIKYYRAEPDDRSRDGFLKEDTIFKREVVKEIQVLVPDNQFPTNEFQFDPFIGMGSEGFEVHITRKEFESAFGGRERPRERDAIYIPLNQRMYEVSSVALSDEIHQMHAYWRVKLKKWEDKQNIYNSPEIEVELDDLTVSMDEVFTEGVESDFLKITKPQQYKTTGTGKNDYVRSDISQDISIADDKINNNWTIVSKNYYDLSKLIPKSIAVKYRKPVTITETDNRAFTFWFRSKLGVVPGKKNITSFSDNNNLVQITTSMAHGYAINDVIELFSVIGYTNEIYYVREIIDDLTFVIDLEYDSSIINSSSKVQKKDIMPILYGYNTTNPSASGMSIELMRGYINISINNSNYVFKTNIAEYEPNTWYSAVINLSNQFDQISVYLYRMSTSNPNSMPQLNSSHLLLQYSETKDLSGPISVNSEDNWYLLGSPVDLTNIRIFELPIEEESHDAVLNQYVVRDTQLAILVDNAIPQLKLMRLENPR
jgi:hypothetical protein